MKLEDIINSTELTSAEKVAAVKELSKNHSIGFAKYLNRASMRNDVFYTDYNKKFPIDEAE